MIFNFPDDDGFISIVNADRYRSFFNENWHFDQLRQHFIDEINKYNLLIWKSNNDGAGDSWNIDVLEVESEKKEFRHFTFPINVTTNLLYLSPYADLTMAAQYEDELIPQKHNSNLKIEIMNGYYEVTVRQMFNPKMISCFDNNLTHFEIIFNKIENSNKQTTEQIFWWK